MTNARIKWIEENVKGKRILDIGFASKTTAGELIHNYIMDKNSDSFIVGVDISRRALKLGQENVVIADAVKLPFKGSKFDSVAMLELIEHIWDPRLLLNEVNRVLMKNGRLFITIPNPYDLIRVLRFALRGEAYLGNKEHKFFLERGGIENILKESGFAIEKYKTKALRIPIVRAEFNSNPFPFNFLGYNQCIIARKRRDL